MLVDAVKRKQFVVSSEFEAAELATSLIRESANFEVMPLPDDEWCFTVKAGDSGERVARAWADCECPFGES